MTVEELREAGVRAIGLVLVDNAGIARMKVVPIERLARAAERGVGWSEVWGLALADDSFAHDAGLYSPSGDVRLRADLAAARPVACSPGWAWAPIDHHEQSGETWRGCQRGFLRRAAARATALGLEVMAAWELEWTLAREGPDGLEPLHDGPGYGAATVGRTGPFLLDLVDALAGSGLPVEQVHPEYADGQMEASLGPRDPVGACDDAVLARHVVHALAGASGWRASFAPLVAGSVGNGSHVHVSVWRDGENLLAGGDGPEGLRPEAESFLAGVLAELPALTAIGAPTALSYARLRPSHWSGVYACWGNENREAALRLEGVGGGPASAGAANFEWKSVDGGANPYLALGTLVAAGLAGVERGLALPPPVHDDPADLTEDERAARGIVRLPETLAAATEALEGSAVLREAMGEYLHDRVAAVRRAESRRAAELDEESLITAYRWRF